MEKFNYYFNTKKRIDDVLNGPVNKATMPAIIFNLIWYAYYNISTDEKEIISYIEQWMRDKTNIFHLSAYAKAIKHHVKKMKDVPWRDIKEPIKIRKSELDYITSFNDIKKEKLLFCYLAVAKFMDMSRKTPSHWEGESDTVIFKMARVSIPAANRDYYINELINGEPKAAIYLNYKNDDTSKRIDFISDDENDPVVLELDESNYYELAFTYLNWKNGGGYKKCKKCGRLFRIIGSAMGKDTDTHGKRGNNAQYCGVCAPKYETKYKGKDEQALNYVPKKIVCVDCGEVVYLENFKDSRTCRCEECQRERQLEYQRASMQKLRDVK